MNSIKRPRPMKAWHETKVDENGDHIVLLTVRHEDYQSYSRAVQPFSTKVLRASVSEIWNSFLEAGIKNVDFSEISRVTRLDCDDQEEKDLLEVQDGQCLSIFVYRFGKKN